MYGTITVTDQKSLESNYSCYTLNSDNNYFITDDNDNISILINDESSKKKLVTLNINNVDIIYEDNLTYNYIEKYRVNAIRSWLFIKGEETIVEYVLHVPSN